MKIMSFDEWWQINKKRIEEEELPEPCQDICSYFDDGICDENLPHCFYIKQYVEDIAPILRRKRE